MSVKPDSHSPVSTAEAPTGRRLAILSLAALGVVYGDVGTSPIYAIRECFHGDYGINPSSANVLGVLSLMFWTLILIVSVKYLTFVLRADNRGEGGVIALSALFHQSVGVARWSGRFLLGLGIFAACLLYGDGMITPAISVLSAVEGASNITTAFEPYIIPITVVILLGLFLFQKRGTRGVGAFFGPVTFTWFVVIAVLGIASVIKTPQILEAFFPWHGISFIMSNGREGFLVLGAVFLVVTGTEALYADMGHFGKRPIRVVWFGLVLPALLCNYFGQGALLLRDPGRAEHPFYALSPDWMTIPLVILATAATVIASQAVISGAFSLTRQAIQLGYLPRMRIIHTSATEIGQVYIPRINWFLMVTTIGLVLIFGSSSKLAAAYGVAVTTTMLITSILFYSIARKRWRWSFWGTAVLVLAFLIVDAAFFGANIGKITHGAWFPLAIGLVIFTFMTTWQRGRAIIADKLYGAGISLSEFIADIKRTNPTRVPGKVVFMAGRADMIPPALLHNFRHNKIIHEEVAILTIITEEIPQVPREEKVTVEKLDGGFYRVRARFGFMEDPNVPYALALAGDHGLPFEIEEVSFFLGRESLMPDRRPVMPIWRERILAFLSRNAEGATAYFNIPPAQVLEVGTQVEI